MHADRFVEARRLVERHGVVAPEAERERARRRGRLADIDADDERVGRVRGSKRADVGSLGDARTAPRRKQIHHDEFAAVVGQPEQRARDGDEGEVEGNVRRQRQPIGSVNVMPALVAAPRAQGEDAPGYGQEGGARDHPQSLPRVIGGVTKVKAHSDA